MLPFLQVKYVKYKPSRIVVLALYQVIWSCNADVICEYPGN